MGEPNPANLRLVPGHDARFAEIYQNHFRHVYAYCRRRTGAQRVDDAVADVFLVAWRRIETVPDGERALPWLYGVAYKILGQQWRGASRRKRLEKKMSAVGIQPVTGTEDLILQDETTRLVFRALERLEPSEQEILRLSVWEDLPHAEVADVLGITVEAAKQRLSRARKRLTSEYNRLDGGNTPDAQKGGAR